MNTHSWFKPEFKEIPAEDLYKAHCIEGGCRKLASGDFMGYVTVTFMNKAGHEYKKHSMWTKAGYETRQAAFRAATLAARYYDQMDVNGFPDSSITYERNRTHYKGKTRILSERRA